MHDHCGESLFITPICWSDAHAKLLGADFIDRDPIRTPVPDFTSVSPKYRPRPSHIATELSRDLTDVLTFNSSTLKSQSIKSVMRTFFPATLSKPKSDVDLELHFGRHVLRRAVRVGVLWKHPDSPGSSFDSAATKPTSSYRKAPTTGREPLNSQFSDASPDSSQTTPNQPLLAFVDKTHLASVRRGLYRVPNSTQGNIQNTAVINLNILRSKRLVPKNSDHDSYLVAIMLAIAQSQCYPRRSKSSSRNSSQRLSQVSASHNATMSTKLEFKDVPVRILCHDGDTAEFVVYNTVVTADFLRRFSEPTKAPDADAPSNGGMKVDVTRVPVWPVLGLKERLAKALGSEVTGEDLSQIIDADLETWESEQERKLRMNTLKRKRETPSEGFDTSFDSTDGSPGREGSSSLKAGLGITVASPSLSPRTPKRRRTQAMNELEVC